jgi:hypothetical protein
LKIGIAIIVLALFSVVADAQVDSVYKYEYRFSPPGPPGKPSIKIDSSVNSNGLTKLVGSVKNGKGEYIEFPTILLKENNKKRYFTGGFGKIDTTINPGSYHITINAVGCEEFDTSFSISNKTTFHFNIILRSLPSFTIYDISSKIALTPAQVEKIKACVFKKGDIQKCNKKGVYYIDIEI